MINATIYPADALAGRADLDVIDAGEAVTLSGLFARRVERSPGKIACREYDPARGAWLPYTWSDLQREVERCQQALRAEQFAAGDRIAIRLRNGRLWTVLDQAALGLGLVVVPLYVDDRPDNLAYILGETGARLLVLDEWDHWPVIAGTGDTSALLRVVIRHDGGSTGEADPRLTTYVRWIGSHRAGRLEVAAGDPDQLASIVYTSGTTGRPKGVMLSHRNMLGNAFAALKSIAVTPDDVLLSFLPLSHALERTAGYYLPMMAGAEVVYNRAIARLSDDLQAIRPTLLIAVPRIFERADNAIKAQLAAGSPVKRWLFDLTVVVGWRRFEVRQRRARWQVPLLWPVLQRLVGARVQARFGGRLRGAISGGAPLPAHIARMFIGLGIDIFQGYGLTEASPVLSCNTLSRNHPDSVGLPLAGVRLRIGENDELLAQGPNVMLGYWRHPVATDEVIDTDGWLHTGDCARLDTDGFIHITGRIKDILVLANGEKVSPADMEAAISWDPLFDQIMVVGEGKPFLTALAVLNPDQWRKLAARRRFADEAPASGDAVVEQVLLERVHRRLGGFPGYAQIHRLSASLKPWTVENGLSTLTFKLKRPAVRERFGQDIKRMYEGH